MPVLPNDTRHIGSYNADNREYQHDAEQEISKAECRRTGAATPLRKVSQQPISIHASYLLERPHCPIVVPPSSSCHHPPSLHILDYCCGGIVVLGIAAVKEYVVKIDVFGLHTVRGKKQRTQTFRG